MELMHFVGYIAIAFALYVMACERVTKNRRIKAAARRTYVGGAL